MYRALLGALVRLRPNVRVQRRAKRVRCNGLLNAIRLRRNEGAMVVFGALLFAKDEKGAHSLSRADKPKIKRLPKRSAP